VDRCIQGVEHKRQLAGNFRFHRQSAARRT
jgi:hypothetical protein